MQQAQDIARTPDDHVLPFAVQMLDVRGRITHLGAMLDTMLARHNYPDAVNHILAQLITLTSLLGTSLKLNGSFIVQTNTNGPLSMMVVQYNTPGKLRACARFDLDAVQQAEQKGETSFAQLVGIGHLAMTIGQACQTDKFQGIVALDGATLEEVALNYFTQSEQIPTSVRLAVGTIKTPNGPTGWRAGGAYIQYLPQPSGSDQDDAILMPVLPRDDGHVDDGFDAPENWQRARILFATLQDHELLDPCVTSEQLLFQLFHADGVGVFPALRVSDECSCSSNKVYSMLSGFSRKERIDMAKNGVFDVECEFCGKHYQFALEAIDQDK